MRRSNFTFKYIPQRIESKDLNRHLYISVPCIQHDSQQLQGGNNPSIHHWVGQTMLYIHTMDSNGLSVTSLPPVIKKKTTQKVIVSRNLFSFPLFPCQLVHIPFFSHHRKQRPKAIFSLFQWSISEGCPQPRAFQLQYSQLPRGPAPSAAQCLPWSLTGGCPAPGGALHQ